MGSEKGQGIEPEEKQTTCDLILLSTWESLGKARHLPSLRLRVLSAKIKMLDSKGFSSAFIFWSPLLWHCHKTECSPPPKQMLFSLINEQAYNVSDP